MICHAQTAQDLGVTEQSSFKYPADGRDPMLPIGWEKPPEVLPAESGARVDTGLKPEMFVVSSISLDHIRLAVINGKPYGEGDVVAIQAEGKQSVRAQVLTIQDGMVTLGSGALRVVCPLRLSLHSGAAAATPAPKKP